MILAPGSSAAQYTYEKSVQGKALVEGLGFEGAVTVYDDTPRMFRRLGKPRVLPRFPLWYFYDQGRFHLVVQAEFRDGIHRIKSIKYTNDSNRQLITNTGVRLGDPISQAVATYGEPATGNLTRTDAIRNFKYPGRGISFHVGKNGLIESISVYRPLGKSAPKDDAKEHKPQENSIIQVDKSKLLSLTDIGVELSLDKSWKTVVPMTKNGGSFAPPGGEMTLSVHVCPACEGSLMSQVNRWISKLSPNQIPNALRAFNSSELKRRNAVGSYLGLHASKTPKAMTWVVGLSKPGFVVVMVMRLNSSTTVNPTQKREIIRLFRELKLGRGAN